MAKDDIFRSPNGEMRRLEDIKADSSSILGAWSGMEWKFEEETGLGKTKENFALGRLADGKFGIIVYRAQELSTEGTRLLDRGLAVVPVGPHHVPQDRRHRGDQLVHGPGVPRTPGDERPTRHVPR